MAKVVLARGADPKILFSTGALAIDDANDEGYDKLVAYLRRCLPFLLNHTVIGLKDAVLWSGAVTGTGTWLWLQP